jgi:hypothetical protein
MNVNPDNPPSTVGVSPETEYTALRSEILKRIELRHQLISITLTIAGAFFAVGVSTALVTLIYPPLATFLALSWVQNDLRVGMVGKYIREHYESLIPSLRWETYIEQHRAEGISSWRISFLSHGGIFLVTQLMAIGIALFKFTSTPLEFALLVIDLIAVGIVVWALNEMRK